MGFESFDISSEAHANAPGHYRAFQMWVSEWIYFLQASSAASWGGNLWDWRRSLNSAVFMSFFGLPINTVAGVALMGTFVTSVAGVIFYQAMAPFYPTMSIAPDWLLGALFGLGGIAGKVIFNPNPGFHSARRTSIAEN